MRVLAAGAGCRGDDAQQHDRTHREGYVDNGCLPADWIVAVEVSGGECDDLQASNS